MKKMNKKGFTLIELLAIIVILAIIAVITVPIILNIIDEAKKGAEKNSVIGYGKAVELAYTQYLFEQSTGVDDEHNTHLDNTTGETTTTNISNGKTINISIDNVDKKLKVDFDGDKVVCTVGVDSSENTKSYSNTITSGVVKLENCVVNNGTTKYSYTGGKATTPTTYTTVTP